MTLICRSRGNPTSALTVAATRRTTGAISLWSRADPGSKATTTRPSVAGRSSSPSAHTAPTMPAPRAAPTTSANAGRCSNSEAAQRGIEELELLVDALAGLIGRELEEHVLAVTLGAEVLAAARRL